MKSAISFYIIFFTINLSHAQCGSFLFEDIGYHPAQCRLYSYQSGQGVVYAEAIGGAEPYTYLWTNLSNGTTNSNTTWGGLNIGEYQIQVYDQLGCVLIDTVEVDSINPQPLFSLISDDFDTSGTVAFLPFEGQLEIESLYCHLAQPSFYNDTLFYWEVNGASAVPGFCDDPIIFTIEDEGFFTISLTEYNFNGCFATQTLTLEAVLPTYAPIANDVFFNLENKTMLIEWGSELPGNVYIVNSNGNVYSSTELIIGTNEVQLQNGLFFYSIINSKGEILKNGKAVIP